MSTSNEAENPPSPSASMLEYLQNLQRKLQPLTQAAAQLPSSTDLAFHRSLDRSLGKDLDHTKSRIADTLNNILSALESSSPKNKSQDQQADAAHVVDESGFARLLGDTIDTLLENADTCLDEFQGKAPIKAHPKLSSQSTINKNDNSDASSSNFGPLPSSILNANIRPLPQTLFHNKPDNSREKKWMHTLSHKAHAKVPLSWRESSPDSVNAGTSSGVRSGMYCAEGDPRENPYYYEINHFMPPSFSYKVPSMEELQPPPPLQTEDPSGGPVPFLWVNDKDTFQTLYDHLMEDSVQEVAVDVEHHNYRSYQGIVCLVQISTRWRDFIVDGLSPAIRDISHSLNDVFADEEKITILHGAEHDILWLQRDLGIYIVGLFDTYHATNVLDFPQHGLAYLLSRYINFIADKRYQLADWRIRPLPPAMLYYARSDTHSLIHIYDCLRFEINKVVGAEGIKEVFDLSKRTACKTYAKEEWNDSIANREGWRMLWKRLGGEESFGVDVRWEKGGVDGLTKTERIFRALHDWRDLVARTEDESPRYILSSANMLNIASRAPNSKESVLASTGPAFKRRCDDLFSIVQRETQAFEAVQERSAAIQREWITESLQGNPDDDTGKVVARSESQSLWPTVADSTDNSRGSRLASLFRNNEGVSAVNINKPSPPKSLFTSMSKEASIQSLLNSVQQDLTHALGKILGGSRPLTRSSEDMRTSPPLSQSIDGGLDATDSAENPVDYVETSSRSPLHEQIGERSSPSVIDEHNSEAVLTNVKKSKRKNKRKSHGESHDGPQGTIVEPHAKKKRWSKQEKLERKSLPDDSTQPFDYTNSVSVLDHQATAKRASEPKNPHKKERVSSKDKTSAEQGRYANVPVGRDRREQAGGKSMTFSR